MFDIVLLRFYSHHVTILKKLWSLMIFLLKLRNVCLIINAVCSLLNMLVSFEKFVFWKVCFMMNKLCSIKSINVSWRFSKHMLWYIITQWCHFLNDNKISWPYFCLWIWFFLRIYADKTDIKYETIIKSKILITP